jgi:hypothetical protein
VRVECESCKALADAAFTVHAAEVRMACPACGATMTAAATTAAATTAAVQPAAAPLPARALEVDRPYRDSPGGGDADCPKCGAPRTDAPACAECGLATERMAAFAEARAAAVPEVVRAAWDHVIAEWSDPARHDALFGLAAEHTAYAWVAACYRGRARARGGDPVAERQLERLRRAAEATLFATGAVRPVAGAAPYKGVVATLGVLIIVLLAGVFYAIVKSRAAEHAPPVPSGRAHSSAPRVPGAR